MKKEIWLAIASAVSLFLAPGCTTNVIGNEPPSPDYDGADKELSLSFKIMQNNYTRSVDDDDNISSLSLVFYHIDNEGTKLLTTQKINDFDASKEYKVTLNPYDESPNAVLAVANLPADIDVEDVLDSNPKLASMVSDGGIIMCSARYFDDTTHSDIFYTPIGSDNINGGKVVEIFLERAAAKITVSADEASLPPLSMLDIDSKSCTLNLSLLNWDVIATDKESYLLKNNDGLTYSALAEELGVNGSTTWLWNNPAKHSLSWAHSVNWGKEASDFPKEGQEGENSITRHMKFGQVANAFNSSQIYNETTRPASLHSVSNAMPSVVIAGRYKIGNSGYETLYRQGDRILNFTDVMKYIARANKTEKMLYDSDGLLTAAALARMLSKTSNSAIHVVFPFDTPNLAVFQINPEYKDRFHTSSGSIITDSELETINQWMKEKFGTWEIYEDGYCFFHIPVEHLGKASDAEGRKTGSYGIVRNHHYNVSIKSIDKIGHGVKADAFIGTWGYSSNEINDNEVGYKVAINEWVDVNQDVNLTE